MQVLDISLDIQKLIRTLLQALHMELLHQISPIEVLHILEAIMQMQDISNPIQKPILSEVPLLQTIILKRK